MIQVPDAPWVRNPDEGWEECIYCDECGKKILPGEEFVEMDALGCYCPACAEFIFERWHKVL